MSACNAILSARHLHSFSSSELPAVLITVLDFEQTCGALELLVNVPRPPTSSLPFDIHPEDLVDPGEYLPPIE